MTTVYTISFYNCQTGTDGGVLWVTSTKEAALEIVIQSIAEEKDEIIKDIDKDIISTKIYTSYGIYSIEDFTVDDY